MKQNNKDLFSKFKAIFTDIDGTILNSADRLPDENKRVIETLISKGIFVVFASGRSTESIRKMFLAISEEDFNAIAFNGCEITIKGKLVYRKTLSNSNAVDIAKTAMKMNLHVHAYSEGNLVFFEKSDIAYKYSNHTNLKPLFVDNFIEYLKNKSITKLLIITVSDNIYEIREFLSRKFTNVNFVISGPEYLDILPMEVDKGKALSFVCNKLKISPNDSVVIGDSENDLPMIERAGLSVVMENGLDKLKDKADIIAPSNQDNGFAKMIKRLFKI